MSTVPIICFDLSFTLCYLLEICCVAIRALNRGWKLAAAAENGGSVWNSYWEYVGMLGFI
jgi:NO-binding membrane sensor protein with MHYT domain